MRKLMLMLFIVVFLAGCDSNQDLTSAGAAVVVQDSNVEEAIGAVCEDSDGGIVKDVYGEVSGTTLDGEDYDLEDRCIGNILIEYYCEDDKFQSQNFRCTACKGGAC